LRITHIVAYYETMNRKRGVLIPIEAAILSTGISLAQRGEEEFWGVRLQTAIEEAAEGPMRVPSSTLYRALDRLERMGYVASHWEDPLIAEQERRPRRCLYRVTPAGAQALATAPPSKASPWAALVPGWAPS
jgi:hypothetical protein